MSNKVKDMIAILLIGDGIVALLRPQRHVLLWKDGPKFYQDLMEPFVKMPGLTRLLSFVEIMVGLWLASAAEDV